MAQKKKRGLIDRFMLGSEKSEGYARAQLPSNRWELFWDIFKGRFGKLVIVNLLVLLFCLPLIFMIFFRYIALAGYGAMYPFSQSFGVGFGALPSMVGYSENIVFMVNMMVYLFTPIIFAIMAVGIAGGAYVIRNMVWTEGIFVANDFWRGIRQNIKQMLMIALVYAFVFYLSNAVIALCDQMIVTGEGPTWIFSASQIITYVFMAFFSVMTLHMITMSVTYNLKFRHLLKNSFLFTLALLPQNVFFIIMAFIPVILIMFGGFFFGIGIILLLLFGLSLALLVWTDYSQWIYDRYVNDKVPGAQKNRGIYEKIKESDSAALRQYSQQIALTQRSSLNSKPIKPITDDELKVAELPTSFNRSDLEKLRASKQAIYEDHARYVEEHKNDPEFQPTEAELQAKKNSEEREKRIEKAKKELSKRKYK